MDPEQPTSTETTPEQVTAPAENSTPAASTTPANQPSDATSTAGAFLIIIIIIGLVLLPIGLIWLVWKKTNWSKGAKWGVTAAILAASIGTFAYIMNSDTSGTSTQGQYIIQQS